MTTEKPTPTPEEMDAHARGERLTEHEHDGSPVQPSKPVNHTLSAPGEEKKEPEEVKEASVEEVKKALFEDGWTPVHPEGETKTEETDTNKSEDEDDKKKHSDYKRGKHSKHKDDDK